jgi:sugar-specific transcriptional regulator TrmB
MDFQREIQTLTRLGLTANQAKVYLTLAKSGLSDAETLSQESGVARPEIYRIMLTLERIGLIKVAISIPRKFKAISISEAVSTLINQRKKETIELETESKEVIAKFENKETEAFEKVDHQFILIPKKKANVRERLVLIQDTLNSIKVITSQNRIQSVPQNIIEELSAALRRDVKIRLIMYKPNDSQEVTENIEKLTKTGDFEVRHVIGPPRIVLSIYDNKEALITTSAEGALAASPALWTNNSSLVMILQEYFDALWRKSIKWDGTN